jgi:hypothetical protein
MAEWAERGFDMMIIGGRALVARGLRDHTKDIDTCLTARQCPGMLAWLQEKESQGGKVRICRLSAPLHPDWLSRGWSCHVEVAGDRLDFFGVPFRASDELARRFWRLDRAPSVTIAPLDELGHLKRTERPLDWADIERLVAQLRVERKTEVALRHLFGLALAEELIRLREHDKLRAAVAESQLAEDRPIFRLGLEAEPDQLRTMARAEMRFWEVAGELRTIAIRRRAAGFWRTHGAAIDAPGTFLARHEVLVAAARTDLPVSPIDDSAAMLAMARAEAGVDRWVGLLPSNEKMLDQYFPAQRPWFAAALQSKPDSAPT